MTAGFAFVSDGLFVFGAVCFVSALFRALGKGALKKIFSSFTIRGRLYKRETPAATRGDETKSETKNVAKNGTKKGTNSERSGVLLRAFLGGCSWALSWAAYSLWLAIG